MIEPGDRMRRGGGEMRRGGGEIVALGGRLRGCGFIRCASVELLAVRRALSRVPSAVLRW
jgi:hypothetical protein